MAAPTYNWNTISADQCDADSPLDEILMEGIRQNLIHLEEWLGADYTAAKNHDHDGTNSKTIIASIGQNELKTTTGGVSLFNSGNEITQVETTLPGGEYGFCPQWKCTASTNPNEVYASMLKAPVPVYLPTNYTSQIYLYFDRTGSGSDDQSLMVQLRYITASGTEFWLFLLYDKNNKKIRSAWSAPDHPCYGNGNDTDRIPHPFSEYHRKTLPKNLEIVLLDIDSTNKILQKAKDNDQSVMELLHDMHKEGKLEIDFKKEIKWQPRDMDGKRKLEKNHDSYTIRKIKE